MFALVTGATGFVGANLVEALNRKGWRVRALRRKSSSLKALEGLDCESAFGDVVDFDSVDAATRDIEIVFHVAATATYWRSDTATMYRVNVDGTQNLMRAAKANRVKRVIFVSSAAAIGKPPFGNMRDESGTFNLQPHEYHYGYTKHLAEEAARENVREGLDVVTINPSIIMGPRDVNFIGGSIITELSKRDIPFVPPGGVGMIDVADVCEAMIAAVERGRTGERYLLNGENLWHTDVLRVCKNVVGRNGGVGVLPKPLAKALAYPIDWLRALRFDLPLSGEQLRLACETFWFDSSKARKELSLTTRPFHETAQRTFEWYVNNGYINRQS
jgi:dihydroflavonol-4-reductase